MSKASKAKRRRERAARFAAGTQPASGASALPPMPCLSEEEFAREVSALADDLNRVVFPALHVALMADPRRRATMNPAFPYPRQVRVGLLPTHLVVEYVGPEDPRDHQFAVQGAFLPEGTILDFLGIDISHLHCRKFAMPTNVDNIQFFLGDAMRLLGDYMFDIVENPNDLMLNGIFDFAVAKEPTFVSNTTFLWSDADGALRVRRIDFMELMPVHREGWPYHTEESLVHFAQFLASYRVPPYRPALHSVLNEFIQLVAGADTTEPQITTYLAAHPQILQLAFGANELNPQTLLEWQYPTDKPNLQPDFMPVKMDGYADILEFKLPRLKSAPLVGTATRRHPSFEIDSALAQIDEYNEWCSQEVNRRWLERTKGIKVLNPDQRMVIGHRDEFSAEDRQRMRARRDAVIFTYDEFIEMARMQLYRVR